jgi:intracellular sulfur oxidation DsrE/DsrF family protein
MTAGPWLAILAALLVGCAPAVPLVQPAQPGPLVHTRDVRVVYQVHGDKVKHGVGEGLHYAGKLLKAYDQLGVPQQERKLVVVVHGAAGYLVLNDAAWKKAPGPRELQGESNPNASAVADLLQRGASVEICANTMQERGWVAEDILPGVRIVPGAYPRVIDLQLQGYAHILFD